MQSPGSPSSPRSLSFLVLALLAACSGDSGGNGPPGPPASVTLQPSPASVLVGDTIQMSAVVKDASGAVLSGVGVSWQTGNGAIATVSTGGRLAGVSAGSTTVTATAAPASGQTTVTVANPGTPASVTLQPNPVTMQVGDTVQMNAIVKDASGAVLSGVSVSWQTGNGAVATASSGGKLAGVSAGSTTVTATAAPASGQANVTVSTPGTGLHEVLSTYIGGTKEDMARDVAVDPQGNIIVVGNTISSDFPTTPGSLDPTYNCCGPNPYDAWIMKTSPSGSVLWSTYLGGINYERAYAVETDAQGYIYVAGRAGAGFPTTPGVFQPTFGGGSSSGFYGPQDAFVCKIQPSGASVVWCSYFGTTDQGIMRDIAVDGNGDIYIAGWNDGGSFPSAWFTNAYQKTRKAGMDVLVAKIKGDGTQVLWATYLGGSGDEGGSPAVRIDKQGNVIVETSTTSPDMPLANPAQANLKGTDDMYLAKLSPDGSTLLYGTYLGGSGTETSETHGLELDANGNAFVAAVSSSTDIATSATAYQKQYGGGSNDNVVWKISPAGAIMAVTYVGGNGGDGPEGVAVDGQGNVYFAANTDAPNFPLTIPSNPGGLYDLVGVELSSDLSQLLFSIRIGGDGGDIARAATVDAQGNFYLVGHTQSTNFPVMNALQPNYAGGQDGLLVKIAP